MLVGPVCHHPGLAQRAKNKIATVAEMEVLQEPAARNPTSQSRSCNCCHRMSYWPGDPGRSRWSHHPLPPTSCRPPKKEVLRDGEDGSIPQDAPRSWNRSASRGAVSPRGGAQEPRTPGVATGATALTIPPKTHLADGAPQTVTHRRIRAPRGHGRSPRSCCCAWLSLALWAPCVQSPASLEAEAAPQQGGAPRCQEVVRAVVTPRGREENVLLLGDLPASHLVSPAQL